MESLPIIRFGDIYYSNECKEIVDCERKVFSKISLAIPLIFKMDIMKNSKEASNELRKIDINKIFDWIKKAGKIFASEKLKICGAIQSPEDYCKKVMKVTGLPLSICKNILVDMQNHMEHIDEIVSYQFRSNNLEFLNTFKNSFQSMSYGVIPKADSLCIIMPGNHPIVNMMWIIAFAMKYPIIIKPSFDDPYTPLRLIFSLIKAGANKEFFSFYPVEHNFVTDLLKSTGYGIVFCGPNLEKLYKNYPWIKVYGPGNSKILVGNDFSEKLDMVSRFASKSSMFHCGRACICTSSIILDKNAEKLSQLIGNIFSEIKIKDLEDSDALIGAFKDEYKAQLIENTIYKSVKAGNVIDMNPDTDIIKYYNNKIFLMPKVLYCKDISNPIFGTEYPFPFITIGKVKQNEFVSSIKNTLQCCLLSDDNSLLQQLILSTKIEKVLKGFKIPNGMDFRMPHNGFIADFLYKYKALNYF